jgi:hypothetical protein
VVPEVRTAVSVAVVETSSLLLVDPEGLAGVRMLLSQAVCLTELLLR